MTEKIIIIGALGSAKVLADQIFDSHRRFNGDQEFLGFAFDDPSVGPEVNGFPILCGTRDAAEKYHRYHDIKFMFQMYRPDVIAERVQLRESLGIAADRWATFLHPLSYVAASAKIGRGCAILSFTTVNANASIGEHNTFQAGCTIGHDAVVGNNNFVASQTVIGNCTVGDNNFFGLNSNTNNFISIENDCFIAMGSNVVKSLRSSVKVMGNPAKPFESKIRRM